MKLLSDERALELTELILQNDVNVENNVNSKIGLLSTLSTNSKNNIVNAINELVSSIAAGGTGTPGAPGQNGKSLEFNWDGTRLGVRLEGDTTYQYVDLKGDPGENGSGMITDEQIKAAVDSYLDEKPIEDETLTDDEINQIFDEVYGVSP